MSARAIAALAIAVLAACHHGDGGATTPIADEAAGSAAGSGSATAQVLDRMLGLLPDNAQVIVEIDLDRLRANAVVGEVAKRGLAGLGADSHLPGLPVAIAGSPLAGADAIVLAAYGVGTAQATTVTLLATAIAVPGAVRLAPDIVAVGDDQWVAQVAERAQLAAQHPLVLSAELRELRRHAEPKGATGAVMRVTARLTFDARVALARLTGVDAAPARISLWADIADDLAVVVDADAVDPGDPAVKDAAKRMAHTIRGLLEELGDEPLLRNLGVGGALGDARLIADGTWVRTVIAVGPHHLARVADRARAMLDPAPASTSAPAQPTP